MRGQESFTLIELLIVTPKKKMQSIFSRDGSGSSFTLIELLIVIGILAVLVAAVVVTLNPAQLLAQARDAQRIQDLSSLSSAINTVYVLDQTVSFGTASTVYTSLPDSSSTCGSWGLPSLPSGWSYHCSPTSTLQNTNGTGWIPVNFQSNGTVGLSVLPIDPTNSSSTGLYYTYITGGSYELTAVFESAKYKQGGGQNRASTDGGVYANLYEVGTNLTLAPIDFAGTSSYGYAYRRAITINHTQVPNTDQTDFPLLFSGAYSYLATVANGGNVQNAQGDDIIFTADAAGNTVLPFEQESYSSSTGAVAYWVKIPTLSHTADTVIYLWYGNSNIAVSQAQPTAVWSNGYRGVWHFANGTTLSLADSTANGNNGTNNGATAIAGQIGGGVNLNGSQFFTVPGSAVVNGSAARTISMWFKTTATAAVSTFFSQGDNSGNGHRAQMLVSGTGTLWTEYENASLNANVSGFNNGSWHNMTFVYTGTNDQIYVDGALKNTGSNALNTATTVGTFGRDWSGSNYFAGTLDEARISTVARSADWIATTYNNESSPSTFYSVGTATAL